MSAARIAIIGGGFSGATVALNLLRTLPEHAARVTIVEPRAVLGAGLAYSTADPAHRVNVPASRLLVLSDAPGAFDDWLKSSGALDDDPSALLPDGRAYPRRGVFGVYVDQLLRAAATPGTAPFRHVRATAEHVAARQDGYWIGLDDGSGLAADIVVLAVSHPPPAVPAPLRPVAGQPKFIVDPWAGDVRARLDPDDRVLIIGTALTAADIVSTLHGGGHNGEIVAISRRGLISRHREVAQTEPFGDFTTAPSTTCLALLRKVRRAVGEAAAGGSCWEAVMEAVRAQGLAIWTALPPTEKHRFLRHLRPFWDVHRYQLAPQPAAAMAARCDEGRLRLLARRLRAVSMAEGRFRVTLGGRGGAGDEVEVFDAIVNCTGPDHASILSRSPVLASLARSGLLVADPFGLGIQTDGAARAIAADGQPRGDILVAGPLARAAFGELMGLPQVTHHAALVAANILAAVTARPDPQPDPAHAAQQPRQKALNQAEA